VQHYFDYVLSSVEMMCRMTGQGQSGTYAVVVFTDDNDSVSVVPTSWLDGDKSYWAPYKSQDKIDRAVKSAEKPKKDWQKYSVRILGVKGEDKFEL
jgi:hypothetical protein